MKRLLIGTLLLASLASCLGKKQYYMSKQEKSNQKGYHANTANKVVSENEKNRSLNQKASEKNRQKTNEAAAEKAKTTGKAKKASGEFKFYFH
jgi:organic hydroperoxide reductase OsmC/OhrA